MDSWGEMTLEWAQENQETWLSRKDYDEAMKDYDEGMTEVMQGWQRGELTLQQSQEIMQKRLAELMQKQLQECVQVLTPTQSIQLENVLIRRLISSKGLHAALVDGKLGRRLHLSSEQASAIRELAETHLEQVVSESQALEQKVWGWIIQDLSPEQAKLIRDELAVKLEHLPGSPSLLLGAFVR
jgi:hypothetical protein